jgi:hypothetical protein
MPVEEIGQIQIGQPYPVRGEIASIFEWCGGIIGEI